jgi:hypothetical protein
MRIDAAGNVGIGTTSPANTLDIAAAQATLRLQSTTGTNTVFAKLENTAGTFYIARDNSAGSSFGVANAAFLYETGANPIVFFTNSAERMRITSAGNVGIGTTSPAARLQVAGSAAVNTREVIADFRNSGDSQRIDIRDENAATTQPPGLYSATAGYGLGLYAAAASAPIILYAGGITNSEERMRILGTNGNVGIGTTAPSSLLSLSKTGLVDFQLNASDQATDEKNWVWQAGAPVGAGVYRLRAVNDAYTNGVNAVTFTRSGISSVTATFSSSVEATSFIKTSGTASQYLMADGSVSTLTNPVTGTGTTNYVPKFTSASAIGNSQIFDNGTNVGIGTTSPGEKLDVNGNVKVGARLAMTPSVFGYSSGWKTLILGSSGTDYTTNATTITFGVDLSTNPSGSYTGNGGEIFFRNQVSFGTPNAANDGYLYPMVFNNGTVYFPAGNVGIGTTAPTAKLHVWNGGIKTSAFPSAGNPFTFLESNYADSAVTIRFQNINPSNELDADLGIQLMNTGGSITDVLIIKGSTGNVGIGTTSPSYKLTVDGDSSEGAIGIERTTVSANTVIGALNFTNNNAGTVYGRVRGGRNSAGDGYVSLGTGLGDSLYAVESGNIGIGTASPGAKLHNYSTATSNVFISGYGTAAQNDWGAEHAFFVNANNGIIIGKANAQNDTNRLYTFYNDAAGNAEQYIYNTSNTATIKLDSAGDTYFNGGNVGIGTTGPTEKLHVDGSTLITYNNSFQSTNSVGNKAILARVSPTSGIVNYAEYATATNLNGFVIGSDDARVKGNITGDSLEFITNTSTRMTVLSSGNVGINTTTPGSTLHVVGDVLIQTGALGVGVNPNATDGRIDASNDIVAFSTSDKRLKENITPIANALEKVRSLTGVEFDWKEETKSVHGYEGHDVGVIAQDVQAVLPEAVRTNDTGYLSVRYEKMIALLIEANKELASRVEQLEKLIK